MNVLKLDELLRQFLIEDIGYGDRTGEALFTYERNEVTMAIVAKEGGIFAGEEIVSRLYRVLDDSVEVQCKAIDGTRLMNGQVVCLLKGRAKSLLAGERVLLNLLQRMSGIASATLDAINTLDDPSICICDTRKTVPGMRMLDKRAVQIGGGRNHRFGLDDAVMLKENHIAACGSIKQAVATVKKTIGPMVKVEVETTNLEEVRQAVDAQADVIMFDNASPADIHRYIQEVPKEIVTEASGGINMQNLSSYAHTGVDVLSLGFLTHSVRVLDLSMLVEKEALKWN